MLFTNRATKRYIPRPYLGANWFRVTPISKYDLTMRFRHQRFKFHSRSGDFWVLVYTENSWVSIFLWFSERIQSFPEASASSSSCIKLSFRTHVFLSSGGLHLEVKKKSPWRSRCAPGSSAEIPSVLLVMGVGDDYCLKMDNRSSKSS